ncbi:MAG: T9SS type A sorting domain-containing protein [Bacteroidetes bacterium]|nr:T9SS type A sorting domain-containing protein [Bacteroidota bacterium]
MDRSKNKIPFIGFSNKAHLLLILNLSFLISAEAQWFQTTAHGGGLIGALKIQNDSLYAASYKNGIFLSTDSGTTWSSTSTGLTGIQVNCIEALGGYLFAGTYDKGMFRSTDNGLTWTIDTSGIGSKNIRALAVNGNNIFAGTFMDGIYMSSDYGATWTPKNTGLSGTGLWNTSLIARSGILYSAAGDRLFQSANNGTSWTPLSAALGKSITCLAINGSKFYIGTQSGLFYSNNGGVTCTLMSNLGLSNKLMSTLAVNGNDLLVGTQLGGVYYSNNNGINWSPVNSGLPSKTIYALANSGNLFYAGLFSSDVYSSSINNIIKGNVSTNAASVNSGYVKLYRNDTKIHMVLADSVSIDVSGNYTFNNVFSGGPYTIYANCKANYPATMPTYADSAVLWDSAKVVTVSGTTIQNIQLKVLPTTTGKGKIAGKLVKGNKYAKLVTPGDPIRGVDVSIGKKPKSHSSIVAHTTTDVNGDYSFENIPTDDYQVFVDIPGLPMDSIYTVSITSTDTVFNNLNYTADSAKIYIDASTIGISKHLQPDNSKINVYPNPFTNNFNIRFELTKNEFVQIELYNSLGEKMQTIESNYLQKGTYNNTIACNLAPGIYLLKAVIGDHSCNKTIINLN